MTTAVEHSESVSHEQADEHAHPKDSFYVKIALFLAILTGLEIALSYVHWGSLGTYLLFALMIVKFVSVVMFFMHLRFDSKIFGYLFWTGLGLALTVYVAALATFQMFSKN